MYLKVYLKLTYEDEKLSGYWETEEGDSNTIELIRI